ncbi:MAG: hypothetical protein JXL84_16755 [Deltaproteobacteria bacterium]|nr:hypothetical protein [Deltaproteobacteria bacterium]
MQSLRRIVGSEASRYTVTKKLKRLFHKERGTLETDPKNVSRFQGNVVDFFDYVIAHEPSLNRYFVQRSTTLAKERKRNRNLFFRPIGLEILARLYVHFTTNNSLSKLALGLERMNFQNPGGVSDGILWSAGRILAGAKEKTAALDLCLYILGELHGEEEQDLLERLREIKKDPSYALPKTVHV